MNAYGDTGIGERDGGPAALLRDCRFPLVATMPDDAATLRTLADFDVFATHSGYGNHCKNQSIGSFKASMGSFKASIGNSKASIEST